MQRSFDDCLPPRRRVGDGPPGPDSFRRPARLVPLRSLSSRRGFAGLGAAPGLAGAGLLLVYAAAIALNLARGRDAIDCGCGAPGDERSIGVDLVARNLVLAALALGAALPATARALTWLDLASAAAAFAAAAALLAAAEHALSNARRVRAWRNPA